MQAEILRSHQNDPFSICHCEPPLLGGAAISTRAEKSVKREIASFALASPPGQAANRSLAMTQLLEF